MLNRSSPRVPLTKRGVLNTETVRFNHLVSYPRSGIRLREALIKCGSLESLFTGVTLRSLGQATRTSWAERTLWVARVLDRVHAASRLPQTIALDNGPELDRRRLDAWAYRCFSERRPGAARGATA
jgi:hypothetical protein